MREREAECNSLRFLIFQMHQLSESPHNCALFGGHRSDGSVNSYGYGDGANGGQGASLSLGHCANDARSTAVHGSECCKLTGLEGECRSGE